MPFIPVDGCCRRCGCDVYRLDGEFLCEDCRAHRPNYDRAASAVRFEGEARRIFLDFKFRRHLWMARDFVDWMEGTLRSRFNIEEIDLVVPVPMKLLRRIDRGYNQCDILASMLSKRIGKKVSKSALRRVGEPKRQSSLSEDERRENVEGTFAVRLPRKIAGKTVLLVDDVMSTGETLSECAKTLKEAGCRRVWCITLLH
jgi:ComF family protein